MNMVIFCYSAIRCYGDTLIKLCRPPVTMGSLPPAIHRHAGRPKTSTAIATKGFGLASIDHIVGNVELGAMNRWVDFLLPKQWVYPIDAF